MQCATIWFQVVVGIMKRISFLLLLFLITLVFSNTSPAGTEAGEILVGISSNDSRLISFDPYAGVTTEVHGQLNPDEVFLGLAYDPNHNKLYALSQVKNNLYSIDPDTMNTLHIGNLHIDKSASWGEDASALAYDPVTNTLYTAIEHWDVGYTNMWSELCEVDIGSGELTNVGNIDGPFVTSLTHNQEDGHLYGLAVYCTGCWDSPYKSNVIRINPQNANMNELFETPYHTILGFAKKPGVGTNIYYSWINWTSCFYGEVNTDTETVTPLEDADPVGVTSAMVYRDFPVATISLPAEEPMSFECTGHITEVWDQDDLLNGAVRVGDRFSLHFAYDMNAPYKYPDPNLSAPYGISVTINTMVFASEGIDTVIKNNYYDYSSDEVSDQLWISSVWGHTVFPIPMDDESIHWSLTDYSGIALSNNNVLPAGFDLNSWDENVFYIFGGGHDQQEPFYYILGVVDNSSNENAGSAGEGGGAGCFIATVWRDS